LFHDIVTAVDAGTAKPSLRIFETAMQRAGVTAEEILHVGDHPEIDIDGARNAGMRTAWVNRHAADWPVHLKEPDHEVQTMDDVEDLLQHSRGKV